MIKQIKSVIIDDNENAINDLEQKLQSNTLIKICGSATSFAKAVECIQIYKPDLLFLDIEMPDKNGFELIKWLKTHLVKIPHIIFVTGFEEYSIKALKEGAIDFIVKPVDEDELNEAVKKASETIPDDSQLLKLEFLLKYVTENKQLFLPTSIGFRSINTKYIVYISRNKKTRQTEIFFDENNILILPPNYTLSRLKLILPATDFFQVKRDIIINNHYIEKIQSFDSSCILRKGKFVAKIPISRRNFKEFKNKMVL